MSLREKSKIFVKESARHLKYDGIRGIQWPLWMIYNEAAIRGSGRYFGFQGENIFSKNWDLLILLDACRVDLLQEYRDHEALSSGDWQTTMSIAPNSKRFLDNTFDESVNDEINQTALISANPFTDQVLDEIRPDYLDEVWRYAWDDELGTVPASAVTDRGIAAGRQKNHDRYIVHYMQPHFPSVPRPELGSKMQKGRAEEWSGSIWDQLLENDVSKDEVWEAYKQNLNYVLDEVKQLLSNFDARTAIISADHGNAMGERSFYGHHDYPVPEIWEVPWVETTAIDNCTREPSDYETDSQIEPDIEDRLADLGYK
ncbi:putative membrane-associated metal-dependent hydrolase [Haloarcula hispanica N601]|uniref:Membrane-associated metal-dependent hydrolase n=1 Tax=Haloarcula hispanica N601 TaxID=1417673 RepID=V5TS52_HALHI|nr:hypothetical protein [Haloarcula hispanica]AHB67480.2 putative membrane-associated metal-dependent hydrolase [Haloarcula hispanica N601]